MTGYAAPGVRQWVAVVILLAAGCGGAGRRTGRANAEALSSVPERPLVPWQVARYNACLAAIKPSTAAVVDEIARGLDGALPPNFGFHGWNIGGPYRPGAINLLIPAPTTATWPDACGEDPGYPTCLSRPKFGIIVCTPAMGRHLARPEFEPPFRPDVQLAARYFVAVALGHELGHLALEPTSESVGHQLPPVSQRLDCEPPHADRDDLERRCDDLAVRMACPSIGEALARAPSLGTEREREERLIALERLFDGFWVGDKLCLSSYAYDSTIARVKHFGDAYLGCFVSEPDSAVRELARQTDAQLADVEAALRERQRGGWAGHELYQKEPLLHERAILSGDAVVFFASGGRTAALTATRVADDANTLTPELSSWPVPARAIAAIPGPPITWYVLDTAAVPAIHRVRVECGGAPEACRVLEELRLPAPPGLLRRSPSGAWLSLSGTSLRSFDDDSAIAANKPAVDSRASFSSEPLALGDVADAHHFAGLSFRASGLFISEEVQGSTERSHVLPLPTSARFSIDAFALRNGRALMLAQSTRGLEERVALWDCPATIVSGQSVTCQVHDAPDRVRDPLALVTRDLAAVDEPSVDEAPAPCGRAWVVTTKGWTWLVSRDGNAEWTAPANGLAGCRDGHVITIRGGRVDVFDLTWSPGRMTSQALR